MAISFKTSKNPFIRKNRENPGWERSLFIGLNLGRWIQPGPIQRPALNHNIGVGADRGGSHIKPLKCPGLEHTPSSFLFEISFSSTTISYRWYYNGNGSADPKIIQNCVLWPFGSTLSEAFAFAMQRPFFGSLCAHSFMEIRSSPSVKPNRWI